MIAVKIQDKSLLIFCSVYILSIVHLSSEAEFRDRGNYKNYRSLTYAYYE